MSWLDSIQRNLGALTAIAVVGCVCYAGGFFKYAGLEWMNFLEFTDLLAVAWSSIPSTLICLLAGGAMFNFGAVRPQSRSGQMGPRMPTSAPSHAKPAFAIGLVGVFCFFIAVGYLPPHLAVLALLYVLILLFLMLPGLIHFDFRAEALACLVAFMALAFCYSLGQVRGSIAFATPANDSLTINGEPTCVQVFLSGRRGPIVVDPQGTTRFIDWASVTSFRLNDSCPTQG